MYEASPGRRITDDLYFVQVPNLVGRSGQPTNVYIVASGPAMLIDTGSDDGGVTVLGALERFGVGDVGMIVLTHAHPDHAGSARAVQAATGACVALHPGGLFALERWRVDLTPDRLLAGGELIDSGRYHFQVIETPGHAPGHVSLYEPSLRALFAGDLLSGNGTIAVVPPLGSMSDYLASLRKVSGLDIDVIYPGHGPAIRNGNERVGQYIEHRERRARDIRDALAAGYDTIAGITGRLYPDVLPRLRSSAEGTVHAHLLQMVDEDHVRIVEGGDDAADLRFSVASCQISASSLRGQEQP
jgi:glyoxylase-like metal-dependent hydrolase (beta-lactamase superfamily II)